MKNTQMEPEEKYKMEIDGEEVEYSLRVHDAAKNALKATVYYNGLANKVEKDCPKLDSSCRAILRFHAELIVKRLYDEQKGNAS